MAKLADLPVKDIRVNEAALRGVDRENPEYIELVESVNKHGVLKSIVVSEKVDPVTKETYYLLCDGLHRFSAAKDCGRDTIPANIVDLDEENALVTQIILNSTKVETKPAEYAKGILRLLLFRPTMPKSELCAMLNKSPAWLENTLKLTKLNEAYGKVVDEGKMNLTNAYNLAKLPPEEQDNFAQRAITMKPDEFAPLVNARKKEIDTARRQGKKVEEETFKPVSFLQNLTVINEEAGTYSIGKHLHTVSGAKDTFIEGWKMALAWVTHLDPESVKVQEANYLKEKEEEKLAKEKRKQESQARRAKENEAKQAYAKELLATVGS